ncbi:hypothetical protein FHG87_009640 [Trinorchestia longiramus]|nr:hypothetical protein FHG87_009640 [Trinorchestia longiramus]
MPHKLEYNISSFTSEDADCRAQELLLQGPGVRGWCSAKFSVYPQELVLRLRERCHLARVQILAHQACIRECHRHLDCRVGLCVVLDDFHECRVALVAVNVLGNEVEDNNNSVSPDGEGGRVPSMRRAEGEGEEGTEFPPHHDLAFSMYVDTEVIAVMQQLSLKRLAAKKEDRLEYCRRLQRAAELLKTAGERLGKFEIEKRLALDSNDYDKAKRKSQLIIDYRQQVYDSLALDDLLEKKGRLNSNDSGDFSHLPTLPPTPGFTSPPSTSSVPFKAYGTNLPPARPAHSPPVHPPPSPPRPYSPPPPVPKSTPPLPGLRSSREPSEGEATLWPGHGASGAPRAMSAPSPSSHNSYDERTLPALKQ